MRTHPPMISSRGSDHPLYSRRHVAERRLVRPAALAMAAFLLFPALQGTSAGTGKHAAAALSGQQPGIGLELALAKINAVWGESVPFTLTLTNHSKVDVVLRDESPENRAFSVRVSGPSGFYAEGNTASVRIREGEHLDTPRIVSRRTLQSGEAMTVSGDLISWIGELEPGDYSVTAHYADASRARQASRPVSIHIDSASPVSATTMRNPLTSQAPVETIWLNRREGRYDAFLQRSSPNYPPVTYSNRRFVRGTAAPVKAVVSVAHSAGQKVRHVVWVSNSGDMTFFNVGRMTGLVPEAIFAGNSVPQPVQEVLDLPFTDESGTLFAVLVTPYGSARLLELQDRPRSRPSLTALPLPSPLDKPRRSLWCRDAVLALSWVDGERKQVLAATLALSAAGRKPAVSRLTTAENPVLDICLFQRYREVDSGYDRMAVLLFRDESAHQFVRRTIQMDSGKTEIETRFPAGAALRWALMEAVQAPDSSFRYLFVSTDGSVHFANSDFSLISPLVSNAGMPVRETDCPSIMIASEFSKLPGTYIRYIDADKRFQWLKVE